MTLSADKRGWGNPGPPGSATEKRYLPNLTTIYPAGLALTVRREVAPLFEGFVNELVRLGYPVAAKHDDWGWANRDIRGRPGVKSNHAWGLAVDINASTNPMTSDGIVHTDMPKWVAAVAAKYGLYWGGNYSGRRKDPMHFEYLGTPAQAVQLAADLAAHTYPLPPSEDDMWTAEQQREIDEIRKQATEANNRASNLERWLPQVAKALGVELK